MNNELLQVYINAIPGFELVASKEIAIPYYHYNCQFLYSEKRSLPISYEFVLELINLELSLDNIVSLLGIPFDLVKDAYHHLIQTDFIDFNTNKLTDLGLDYLTSHSLNKLTKGEYDILVNTYTGDIDVNINNSISHRDAYQYHCYKALIKAVTPENIKFYQMHKVLKTYCEKNELDTDSKLIDIINLKKRYTCYRKLEVLIYQNSRNENRIITLENGKKTDKYEECLYTMDSNGYDLLKTNVGNFFEEDKVKQIFDIFKSKDFSECPEFIDIFSDITDPIIVLPLIETPMLNDYLYREIKKKGQNKQKVTVFICGDKYKNNYEEDFVNRLLNLQKKNKNICCIHITNYLPLMCFSKDKGCIQILELTQLNLKHTKCGFISYLFMLSKDEIRQIINIEPRLAKNEKLKYEPSNFTNMNNIAKMWYDFDTIFTTKFGFSMFPEGGMRDLQSFVSITTVKDKAKFNDFLNTLNRAIFESIKSMAKKELNDKNFFWSKFKPEYPDLFKNLDKIRVYRNNADHIHLDRANENLYYAYLNEDTNGTFIDFIPNGYEYMQSILLTDMEKCLREIIK